MFERFIRDVALNPMVLRLDPSVFRCNNPSSYDFGAGHGRGGRGGSDAGSNTGMDETRMPEAGDLGQGTQKQSLTQSRGGPQSSYTRAP